MLYNEALELAKPTLKKVVEILCLGENNTSF